MPRYRATTTVSWEYEATDQKAASEWFNVQLNGIEYVNGPDYQGYRDTKIIELEAAHGERASG